MTVSRFINNSGYISKATRSRVEKAIAELGYVPNALARGLRFKQTKTIALILTDITNPFFTTLSRGVEDTASERGFNVIFCNTDEDEGKEAEYLNMLQQKKVDGILLVPARCSVDSISLLQSRSIPLVVLDRRVPGVHVDLVRGDSEDGAYQLVRHLLKLGHRRIAILSGPASVTTATDRVAGYRRALAEASLDFDDSLVYFDAFSQEGGYRMARLALDTHPRPTALFAGNNFIAMGAFGALQEAGLRVPRDVSLVAMDDLPPPIAMDPFLTVAAQPAYEMGHQATDLLLQRLAGECSEERREVILPVTLVVRRSSAPPPHHMGQDIGTESRCSGVSW
jgi:LacI family transcriptional regulator